MTGPGLAEIVLLTPRCSGRLQHPEAGLEPFPTRILVRGGVGEGLEVSLVDPATPQAVGGDRDRLVLDLAADLPDLAALTRLDDLLAVWVPLLAGGERPLPPPRPLLLVLPFGAFPTAARGLRAWAVRRLRRPVLLVSEPLALLAGEVEALAGEAPEQGAACQTVWLPAGPKDPRHLEVQLSRGGTPRAVVVGLRPLPPEACARRCPATGPALVRGAARVARWLLGEPAATRVRLGLSPRIQVGEPQRREPLASWPLLKPQDPFMHSLELRASGPDPNLVELRAFLGPGRGESSRLAGLQFQGTCRLEIQALWGSGEIRLWSGASRSEPTRVPFELPELVA